MNMNIFQWRSIKTRVTLITLAIFMISIWTLTFYVSRMLREDLERVLSEQQFSTASIMAAQVNQDLDDRLRSLEVVAGEVSLAIMGNSAALQTLLEHRPIFQRLFNAGIFATRLDGVAIADVPISTGRIGMNSGDRAWMIEALKGKSTIGRPIIGKKLQVPVFSMAVAIRDTEGKVIGVLVGVTDLGKPNFLDRITNSRYGKTGGYLLIAAQHRLIVTGTDKSRIMQPTPAPGINPLFDRYVQGFEGSGRVVDSRGIEVLSSAQQIPVAGWFLVARIPAKEAFAPIAAMQRRMLIATIFFTLLAGVLTWWMLKRQLAPMLVAAETLSSLSDSDQSPQPLPVTRQDEIGQMIGGFNRLLETLGKRESELKDKNAELESFAYTVSHDLKSPLITIQSYAGMVVRDMEAGKHERAQEDLKRIEGAASRMTALLNDLLELSRVGRMMNEPTEVDMNRLVKNTLGQLAGTIGQSLVEVVLEPDLPAVHGDHKRIAEVVQNLIENAIKYKGEQIAPRIEIGTRQDGKERVFFVNDNGKGIDPAHHERIFGLFKKLDANSEGTGIGLALVKRIIEVHGGRVWVESEGEGLGSRFCFTLKETRK
jgi:signal transduction histidine kinase